jgi:DNA repair photolyase
MRQTKGRGASFNTPNRFETLHREPLDIDLGEVDDQRIKTRYYSDSSKSILARNESPDLPFTYSLNPYRGCEHGCIYCYARPSHEYLGFSAGIDFESKIMVKTGAPALLAEALGHPRWVPQMVALSGNTDCYQPVERVLQLTRKCLEVFLDYRNPVGIITKNTLILRDIDILKSMARFNIVEVAMSVTTLNPDLTRVMEPRTPTPANRLQAIRELADRGIPVGVNVSPIIPGLTDEEIPAILGEAARYGARSAAFTVVRLPGAVDPLFRDWLAREFPDRAAKILNRIAAAHGGTTNDRKFGRRMKGSGHHAESLHSLFALNARRHALSRRWEELSIEFFRRPNRAQGDLFTD